ncbi:hypothetical protein DRP53_06385 [candidate division WOR-3 bacterium]|uniref:Uncharacterized protein n=1 Tax=candidate division WOR-3 bacterium TaxID=2052148 RepID=A0A660SIU0_UNCW3|nr:MAG: hypothetical protein DRP53_06385 [candidate division WOR-3 bacterium]
MRLFERISREYDEIKEEEIKSLPRDPQERAKIFESLCDFVYEFYKAGREYVKRSSTKNA